MINHPSHLSTPADLSAGPVVTTPQPVTTWQSAVELEPELLTLKRLARQADHNDWRAYSQFKRRLERFVGFDARRPELRNSDAYDACHRAVLGVW